MDLALHYETQVSRKCCYVYIRKNACSSFVGMILDGVEIKPEDNKMSRIGKMNRYCRVKTLEELEGYKRRIFVLRPPLERVVSAFLSRVVLAPKSDLAISFQKDRVLSRETHLDNNKEAIDSLTFEIFVKDYIKPNPLSKLDPHLIPVINHLYPVVYTDVLLMSQLYDDIVILMGRDIADRYFKRKTNSTDKFGTYTQGDISETTIQEIQKRYNQEGLLPTKESFLTPELTEILEKKYHQDMELFESYVSVRDKSGGRPSQIDLTNYDFRDIR